MPGTLSADALADSLLTSPRDTAPPPGSRNIVICCDGTWNSFQRREKNTNVVRLFMCLEKDTARQVAYYDTGVGSIRFAFIQGTTGWGVKENIQQAYRYLMERYRDGDRVYLFGFSRGAFTVRALSGLLRRCGLLTRGSENLVDQAYKLYRGDDDEVAAGFKRNFCRECPIHFIGVWDTVKSVLFWRNFFRDTYVSADVTYGCHALALDERRLAFRSYPWTHSQPDQVIEQVWFAGAHSDVGGGYRERRVSDFALRWMLAHARRRGLHLKEGFEAMIPATGEPVIHNSFRSYWIPLGWTTRRPPAGAKVHDSVAWLRDHAGYPAAHVPADHVLVSDP